MPKDLPKRMEDTSPQIQEVENPKRKELRTLAPRQTRRHSKHRPAGAETDAVALRRGHRACTSGPLGAADSSNEKTDLREKEPESRGKP